MAKYIKSNNHLECLKLPFKRTDRQPVYQDVKDYILECIRRGDLPPNVRLPGERALAEHFGVSRMTVRRTLNDLIQEGRIYTEPGVGTYVAEPRYSRYMHGYRGLSEDLSQTGLKVTSQVLEKSVQQPPVDVAAVLKLSPKDSVIVLERLRLVNNEPFALQKAYLPQSLCPDLHTLDFEERSLYRTLRERYGLWIKRSDLTLEAIEPTPWEGDLLTLPKGKPVLVMVRISYIDDDVPIEFIRSAYRGDKYKFSFSLKD